MEDRPASEGDEPNVAHEHSVISKERLDEWLDAALADTFPASDPVASPPSDAAPADDD